MKKTFSMLLAVLMAAIAVCSFSVIGFADEENDDPVDSFVTEATKAPETEAATKAPETEAATKAPETEATKATEAASAVETTKDPLSDFISGLLTTKTAEEVSKENEAEPTVTRAPGQTVIDDGDETTAAPATTKKPAKVESAIPNTGSGIIAPAIALLALAAGTVAVVKTKKED